MQIEVNMKKAGRWVEASVPAARVYTQGKSFKDAAAMVVDAVELLADTYGLKAKASVTKTPDGGWALEFDSNAALIAFVLKRHRRERGLSVEGAAKAVGQRSNQAISRYEHGKQPPTIATLEKLLQAIAPDVRLVVRSAISGHKSIEDQIRPLVFPEETTSISHRADVSVPSVATDLRRVERVARSARR